ncbi:MAG: hypothetical protein VW339_08975 [Quisquiliibacterium sp.]
MKFEEVWYEFSPFLYALVGLGAILMGGSILATISGVLLLVAAVFIIRLRWSARLREGPPSPDVTITRQRQPGAQTSENTNSPPPPERDGG